MVDFLMISTRSSKQNGTEIYPKFIIKKSSDLMVRGGDFYAIWIEELGLWSTDEEDVIRLIDNELDLYYQKNKDKFRDKPKIRHMWDAESGVIDSWHKYCQKQMRDSFHTLDRKLIFSNVETKKRDYASKRLEYPLEPGPTEAWDALMSTLYSDEERRKIEWAIGAVVTGDSKKIQKFLVLYGSHGTGKSTVLDIIQKLFEGYHATFDAKALGSSSASFALEAFKENPLVAIQHDGNLSKIEDNTRINSLVSHELMTVNEKFKSTYSNRFECFLFMGTNSPVKITDAKSGLLRRLIDVSPTGNKIEIKEYRRLVKQIDFELGAIACRCRDVYLEDPTYYDDYTPTNMMSASNDFYNFMVEVYYSFKDEDAITLKAAWEIYKTFCEETKVPYPYTQRAFKEELKNYFKNYEDRLDLDDGTIFRNYYTGFRLEKIGLGKKGSKGKQKTKLIEFNSTESIFDKDCADCIAQYGNKQGIPYKAWDNVKTKLSSIDTSKLHYVMMNDINHIVIDFDIPDEDGNKCFEKNVEAASKWPATYAELSKSGAGVHLHYIYVGDVSKLSRIYDDHIEIKVFNGKSSLRRKLTKCNNLPIASISSGLPLKGDKKMVDFESIKSEKSLRVQLKRNLNKEIHPGTKPSIDFIYKILDDAYNSGLKYDLTDMRNAVLVFATGSTNQADYCIKLVNKMKFKSEEPSDNVESKDDRLIFYDIEVFPNLLLVNWKIEGADQPVVRMINPTPTEIEELIRFKLVGFNCRRYDNHILYARLMGYDNEAIYNLSQKIIGQSKNAFFSEAYNLSYTDVYDFCSEKKSLKKWEIELGIHHQELGLPWDQPVPKTLWNKVAEYCDNDVIATEAVFNARQADFTARKILADIAGMSVNDTTNSLSTRIIFGSNRKPQDSFNYRDMGDESQISENYIVSDNMIFYNELGDKYSSFDKMSRPIFPGYKFELGKSTYRGEEVGEGGYVYSEPGMYINAALLDIASMHPTSAIEENLFGEYTKRFKEIRDARVAIKHKCFHEAKKMLDGVLAKYLTDESQAGALAQALKIAINSVYGLTSAKFDNPFRDPRNKDNIVAKRGALFMINLKHEVQKRGYTVAHIKTDSIKIPNATDEIIQFIMGYGSMYGYTFEHEATYKKLCLVNKSTYIAQYDSGEWTATGDQFQVPYVFKKLFTNEPIEFEDMCETKAVQKGALELDMNEGLPDVSELEETKEYRIKYPDWTMTGLERVKKADALLNKYKDLTDGDLDAEISKGHNYMFVGKVGQFCPIKAGHGGGVLYRHSDDKYYAATGTKDYRWLESEMVRELNKQDSIDRSYYDRLVEKAVEAMSQYGDVDWFRSNDDNFTIEKDILQIESDPLPESFGE